MTGNCKTPLRVGRVLNRAFCRSYADAALPEGIMPSGLLTPPTLRALLAENSRATHSFQSLVPRLSRRRSTTLAHDDSHRARAHRHRSAVHDARRLRLCCGLAAPLGRVWTSTIAPASPRLLALGSLPRWVAPAIYDLPGLCPLTRPSSWTSDLWEPWFWRTSSPAASCRQRLDAGSRAPLRVFGGGGLRPPCETSRLGAPLRLPAHLFGAPRPSADPARAGCARRGSVLNALAPLHSAPHLALLAKAAVDWWLPVKERRCRYRYVLTNDFLDTQPIGCNSWR